MTTFSINLTELKTGQRLDPNYYHPKKILFFKQLESNCHMKKLGTVISDQAYGVLPPSTSYEKNGSVTLLRATELKPDLTYDLSTSPTVNQFFLRNKRAKIKQGDVLLAVKGATIASSKSVAYVGESTSSNIIVNGSIFRFQVIKNAIPKYIAYILNSDIVKKQMRWELTANNAVDYLNKKLIENLLVPIPKKAIEILDKAHKIKIRTEKRAHKLLNSIDDYIRKQLGIDYAEPEEAKTYATNSRILLNSRHDPYYYKPSFIKLEKTLTDNKAVKLRVLLKSIINGLDYRKYDNDGALDYLRVSNIKPYKIDYTDVKKVKLNKADISKNVFGKKNDILLTRKGTYGVSVCLEQDLNALISSEIFLLKANSSRINPQYLSILLNSFFGQKQFLRNKVGTIMGSLSQEAVKDTYIVIPSKHKQLDIVNKVVEILRKANELRGEAEKVVEKAKKKVEGMILN